MADLSTHFIGIKSPNPFWLASAPPTDKAYNVVRAFEAGWGGVVWKTLGEDPPVVNVASRYGALSYGDRRMAGFNNIELISDRPLEVNLKEIRQVKKDWPDRAMIISLMVPCEEENWKNILSRIADTGADGIELNFGCPHGMSERGMGAAVGQVPEYVEMVTQWCKKHSDLATIVKLTPNISNILSSARAAVRGGADAVSLINTINSIASIDLDVMAPTPREPTAATAVRRSSPLRLIWSPKSPAIRSAGEFRFRGLAASKPGGMPPSSFPSTVARCRCARRPCTMDSGLPKICATV